MDRCQLLMFLEIKCFHFSSIFCVLLFCLIACVPSLFFYHIFLVNKSTWNFLNGNLLSIMENVALINVDKAKLKNTQPLKMTVK